MWESTEGLEWSPMLVDEVSNSAMSVLVDHQMAIGRAGAPGCPGDGVAVWGPTDKSDWYRDAPQGFEPGDVIVDAVEVGVDGRVLATGWTARGDSGAWITSLRYFTNGRWDAAEDPPRGSGNPLVALAATDQTVIGWDSTSTAPAWYSTDQGNTWANAEFQAPYWFQATEATASDGGFFAAGSACCTVPKVRSGAVLRSPDGRSWSASETAALRSLLQSVVATGFGLVAIGAETYVSTDGSQWTVGPPLPGYDGVERLFAAAAGPYILVASPTRVWVASSAAFRPEKWPNEAPRPDMPVVGTAYPYHLATRCGPESPIHFDLRTWLPDEASLLNGEWPRGLADPEDWGQLTFLERDILEFAGINSGRRRDTVVRFLPAEKLPPSHPCA
jgi:hypothetical protein